jgi:N-acetylmuramoyl-L-alanine amidase
VTEGELIVEPGEAKELRVPLALGGLDPVTTVSGVKQRLYNLGWDCGDTSQEVHENFAAMLSAFQEAQGLEVTGEVDDATRDRLKKVHGL